MFTNSAKEALVLANKSYEKLIDESPERKTMLCDQSEQSNPVETKAFSITKLKSTGHYITSLRMCTVRFFG